MNETFLSVITGRHCKRAFADRGVPRLVLERVLAAAGHAPSTRNAQFWKVAVLVGEARDALSKRLCAAMDSAEPYQPDYPSRPEHLVDPYQRRTAAWGAGYYSALGVGREDREGRLEIERRNLRFYGAPVAMIFHLPADAVSGTFLEMGFFLQNVMLGLVSCGLGSCPQYSVARYAQVIRDHLGLGSDRLVVCGLSVGYPDESNPVNDFFPQRARVDEYVTWHDHADPDPG